MKLNTALWSVAVCLTMQAGPAPVGYHEPPNVVHPADAYAQYGFEGQGEARYPFDAQNAWLHGYYQEIPAYGGHNFFRPYNYKHVLSQSQVSGGWGMSPTMPYAQQFWHRYHDQATMLKDAAELDNAPTRKPQYYTPGTGGSIEGYDLQSYAVPVYYAPVLPHPAMHGAPLLVPPPAQGYPVQPR